MLCRALGGKRNPGYEWHLLITEAVVFGVELTSKSFTAMR
jgi:hypothetical protein